LAVGVSRAAPDEIFGYRGGESTAVVRERVVAARLLARSRGVPCNAELSLSELPVHAPLTSSAKALLEHHLRSGRLSARGLHRLRRVARTVADLDAATEVIDEPHAAEALALRAGRAALAIGPR
jgi:magnesium chelatase family protein